MHVRNLLVEAEAGCSVPSLIATYYVLVIGWWIGRRTPTVEQQTAPCDRYDVCTVYLHAVAYISCMPARVLDRYGMVQCNMHPTAYLNNVGMDCLITCCLNI